MDLAVGLQRVAEPDAVRAAPAVDKGDGVWAQVALVVKQLAAQMRVGSECRLEQGTQRERRGVQLRGLGEASSRRREDGARHSIR